MQREEVPPTSESSKRCARDGAETLLMSNQSKARFLRFARPVNRQGEGREEWERQAYVQVQASNLLFQAKV